MEIKDDGSQTFTCKIPKFCLSEIPNEQIINPRWQDAENGILAENTRVLKVTVQFSETEQKTFPFIIDKIINKREKNFSTYKEITGNGLAFAELGKIGYKLELNSHTLETDFAKDDTTVATIDYWLDKVFPNEKDEDGVVTKWLTPWCYEIRMDWRGYFEQLSDTFIDGGTAGQLDGYNFYNSRTAEWSEERMKNWLLINAGTSGPLYQGRDETKIYENPYVSNWTVSDNKLRPIAIESFIEKARYIDCANSNKYNITQTLAETFEVFCVYEYSCDSNGYFKKTYWDEYGNVWTGKKVIFFNRAIKTDKPYTINYQHNLQSISRIIDSSEVYTKMYVNPVASETMDTGYVSISDTTLNPLLDDFILNFDYMYEVGSINDFQKEEIENYKVKIHNLNKQLIQVSEDYNELVIQLNNAEAEKANAEKALASAQEQLVNYETLRDNEVTNTPVIRGKTNSYSVVMVPQTNYEILQGTFRLAGINAATIKAYTNNEYDDKIFGAEDLIVAQSPPSTALQSENQNRYYLTLDEDGFPATVFTYKNNKALNDKFEKTDTTTGVLLYFELEYCPKNKYIAICDKITSTILAQQAIISQKEGIIGTDEGEEENWSGLKGDIAKNLKEQEELLAQKDSLNFKLERILGPALREGYWQAETYEDPGEGHNDLYSNIVEENSQDKYKELLFDDVLFQEEQLEYYYASVMDISEDNKTYYKYVDLSNMYSRINNLSEFSLEFLYPKYEWILQKDGDIKGETSYVFTLDSKYYQFTTSKGTYLKDDVVAIHAQYNPPRITIKRGSELKSTLTTQEVSGDNPTDNIYNITSSFQGLGIFLGTRHLYHNAGFVLGFMRKPDQSIIPVALLQQNDIDYSRYTKVTCSFDTNKTHTDEYNLKISDNDGSLTWVYPRIFIDYRNVNYDSDNLVVSVITEEEPLVKFEDYTILLRRGKPYITLKITDKNTISDILNEIYNVIYQVSRANEMLYLDAKQVAKDSSKPKYSYEIAVANLPEETTSLELGQLVHINDYNVDAKKEYGYISGLSYQLDKPSQDSVTVANYKTKFEDLFSSISAQNEAMKQNQTAYNIAAASFTSSGEVEQDVLQTTLDNNNFAFNFSNTSITLDDTGGLTLTNVSQYNNGVYGQVALRGGGVFCSNSVDAEGDRIWTTAITPDGINASQVTTGVLDTNLVRIYAGATIAFQWNSTGLYAFKELSENGKASLDSKSYVRLNESGLLYKNNGETQLELGWDGLRIESLDGHVKLTGENGLQMFDENNKALATFGKLNNTYGMFFTDGNGNVLLQATHGGNLQLIDTLTIGSTQDNNYVGLCGKDRYLDPVVNDYIRFWAGSSSPTNAPVTITEDGVIKAKIIVVPDGGSIQFKKGNSTITLTYDDLVTLGIT